MSHHPNQTIMDLFELLHLDKFNPILLAGLVLRFLFNIGMASVLILFVYRRNCQNKEFAFTLFSFNMIIFALCTILNNVELSIGSGFGLFAVFTMMRYRSEQLLIKDMTYLLIVVSLGFINSTFQGSIGPFEIVFLNIAMIIFLFILEKSIFNQKLVNQKIKYEKLELLKVGNKMLLRQDLESRIGARVVDVKVESVNYLEGSSNIIVKYNRDIERFTQQYVFPNKTDETKEEEESALIKGI